MKILTLFLFYFQNPNILVIMADDLGYRDLGVYGQKMIETPHIDALAAKGMLFTNHYTGSPVCAPARSSFLTGLHTGHAPIRGNDEWASRGQVRDYFEMFRDSSLEGQFPMPAETFTLGHLLQNAGYKTALIGKWGLGAPGTHSTPNTMGFDYFFGYNCQRQAHTYGPLHLWENEQRVLLDNDPIAPHTRLNPNEENYEKFYPKTFSTDLMLNKANDFIQENKNQPFFLFYASPLPHLPLQAPQKWIDFYREKIGNEPPYTGDRGYFPCLYPKATYAAMISYLDEQVGELLEKLSSENLLENTLVVFTSDNGATFSTGGAPTIFFESNGEYGAGYGQSKGFLKEGGIKVPLIVAMQGKIQAGTRSDLLTYFPDYMASMADLVKFEIPVKTDGISFLPTLAGDGPGQDKHPFLYWEITEYGGQQALRMDKWKLYRGEIKQSGNLIFSLYDLSNDPSEQNDIAHVYPELVMDMAKIIDQQHSKAQISTFQMEIID
jgi:arylsulfatase A-like enzyme